jgi:hypothetical protein
MKYAGKLFLLVCTLIGSGAAITANAQIESGVTIRADIPYSFAVGDTQLPAGKYMVRVPDGATDLSILEISSADSRKAIFFHTNDVQTIRAARQSELVFEHVGDEYFLSEVFLSGDNSGNQLARPKLERRLEGAGLKSESRSVAANKQ